MLESSDTRKGKAQCNTPAKAETAGYHMYCGHLTVFFFFLLVVLNDWTDRLLALILAVKEHTNVDLDGSKAANICDRE